VTRSLDVAASRHVGALAISVAGALTLLSACSLLDDDPDQPLLACDRPAVTALEATVDAATGWLGRSQQPDGTYWYEYDRVADEFSDDYNDVRHAGTTMSLYQAAAAAPDEERSGAALDLADAALVYIADGTVANGDRLAFVGQSRRADLGSTALVVAALAHRRIAAGDTAYDDQMAAMGRFMQSLLRDDGGMWGWATSDELDPIEGQTSTFYTGEAFWAFGLLANQFPGDGWDEAATSVAGYIASVRDAEEEVDNPPLADQWAAYGFAEMREWGDLDGAELQYVRSLIDKYHERVGREVEREKKRVGSGEESPDESVEQARGAAFGTTVEALGSLWRLSETDPSLADIAGQVRSDLICGASILDARQYSVERAAEWPRPDVVEGAWFDEDTTRMDDQQHAMSGVLLAVDAVEP